MTWRSFKTSPMGIEMEYGFVISDSAVYVNPNL